MVAVPTTERPRRSLPPSEDGYRFPTDAEMVLAICHALELHPDELQDGRRMRRVNHVIELVRVYHREARSTGATRGTKKRAAVAAHLWEGEIIRVHRITSMLRWEAIAERAGLLTVRDGRGARALEWELRQDWARYARLSRGYSSVGASTAGEDCEARRRPESARERRNRGVGRWRRRVGNKSGAVGRLLPPPPSLKRPEKLQLSGLWSPLKGPPQALASTHTGERADLSDALAPCPPPGISPGAAPDAEKQRIERVGAAAAALFEARLGTPPGGELIDCRALVAAIDRFDRAAVRLAGLQGRPRPIGWPAPGLAYLEALVGAFAPQAGLIDELAPRRRPRHLNYFIGPLVAEARRNEKRCRAMAAHGSPRASSRGLGARRT